MKERTCPNCGKTFVPWRAKRFCSEKCRKQAENRRLGSFRGDAATTLPDSRKFEKNTQINQGVTETVRGYEPVERGLDWTACNEITHKLVKPGGEARGWVIYIAARRAWVGRVRDADGEMSFGPTSLRRAQASVQAYLQREPFEKQGDERSWRGDCMAVL